MAHGVVLDVNLAHSERLGQVFGAHQRRKADMAADRGFIIQRQKVGIAPHGERTGGNCFSADLRSDLLIVVKHLQRAKAELADVDRLFFVLLAALAAAQTKDLSHRSLPKTGAINQKASAPSTRTLR